MGTTFCNLNIHNPNGIRYETNEDVVVVNIAEGWDTLLQVNDVPDPKMMIRMAKAISIAVGTPAILITYFDDIAMVLTVFADGAKKGEYLLDNGYCKKSGLPQLISALELDEKAAKTFKRILEKESDASEVIVMLSALSGIPLFLDKKMYDLGATSSMGMSRKDVIKKYSPAPKSKKAKNSFGEKREAEMLQEISGVLNGYIDAKNGIFSILRPEDDGTLDRGHVHCYQLIQDDNPRLEKSHDIKLDLNALSTMKNIRGFRYYMQVPGWPEALSVYDYDDTIGYIARGDACSKYRDKILVPKEKRFFPKYQILQISEVLKAQIHEGLAAYNQYEAKCLVREGDYYILTHKEQEFKPTVDDFERENLGYKDLYDFYADSSEIVRVGQVVDYSKAQRHVRVDFYGHDYSLKSTVCVPVTGSFDFENIWSGFVYLREKNMIFAGGYAIDLEKKKIRAIGELPDKLKKKIYSCILCRNSIGKIMIAVIMEKVVYFLDEKLKPMYWVRSSDSIFAYFFNESGDMFFITEKNDWEKPYENYKEDSRIRFYRLEI